MALLLLPLTADIVLEMPSTTELSQEEAGGNMEGSLEEHSPEISFKEEEEDDDDDDDDDDDEEEANKYSVETS
jgi:hypothetical protein